MAANTAGSAPTMIASVPSTAAWRVRAIGASAKNAPRAAAAAAISRASAGGEVGRVALVTFDNEQALDKRAAGLYDAGDQAPRRVADPNIQQGKLEGSNAAGVVEMTKLIATVRSYQSAARLADEEHQRQRRAIESLAAVRS